MNLISNLMIFLLLMEELCRDTNALSSSGGQPPSIPYLIIQNARSGHRTTYLYMNQTMQYSALNDNADISEINCDTSGYGEHQNEDWNSELMPSDGVVEDGLTVDSDDEDISSSTPWLNIYTWKLDGEIVTSDNEFVQDANGTLVFLEPVTGLVECFATNGHGVSYASVDIVKEEDVSPGFKLLQGPDHLAVPLNSTVKFNCESDSSKAVYSWTFNAEPLAARNWKIVHDSYLNMETLVAVNVDHDYVGTIGCFVETEQGKLYQEGSIQLIDAPGHERMLAPDVKIENSLIKTLTGQNLHIECQIKGTPDPMITWYHNDSKLTEKETTLRIEKLKKSDAGVYKCAAKNLAGSEYKAVRVEVFNATIMKMNEGEVEQQQLQIGQSVILTCKYSYDNSLNATLEWLFNGEKLEENHPDESKAVIIQDSIIDGSALTISDISDNQFGNYSCVVHTSLQTTSLSWNIERVSPPKILNEMTDRLILQGSLLKLECDVAGEPQPNVSWMYGGQPVVDKFAQVYVSGNNLQIDTVEQVHAGVFTCKADNLIGQDTKEFEVSVAAATRPPEGFNADKIEKLAGEELKLECNGVIDPLLLDSVQYTWFKDGEQISADLLTGSNNQHLTIQYLHSDHDGVYSCQVKTVLDMITLDTELVVMTARPVVTFQTDAVDGSTLREMNGGNVTFQCISTGIPAPTIKFRFDERDYSGRVISKSLNETIAVLELRSVTQKDEGQYACLAINEYGQSVARSSLDVYSRSQILSGPRAVVQRSGDSLTMPCQISTDDMLRDSLKITWLRNKEEIKSVEAASDFSTSLMLTNLTKEDEGIYTCIGETSKDRVSMSGRVTVLFEEPAFSSVPRDIRVLEGRSTQLVCTATGIPTPRVHWTIDGVALESDNGILRLTKLSTDKEGQYECTAVNMYGKVSQSVKLQVIKEARKENENLVPDIVKNIKDDITLPCDFKLDQRIEQETRVMWYKDNQEISIQSSKYLLAKDRSLSIRSIELNDAGQYACTIITPLQRVQSKISLIVSGDTPEIMSEFDQTKFHEGEKLQLTCRAKGLPVPTITWLLQNQPVDNDYIINIPLGNREFVESRIVIEHANKSQDGTYQCVAKNNVGTVLKSATVSILRRTRVEIQGGGGAMENEMPEITVPAGHKLKLPCKVDNDEQNRITRIQWMKNETAIAYGGDDIIDFGMDGSITIFSVQRRHEGVYTCKVTTVNDEESAQIGVKVLVNAPVITKTSLDLHLFSGESATLECTATGIPEPEIRWTFNRTITKVVGPKFEIKSAIATDGGFYTCTASNSIGETEKTIQVSVVTMPHSQDMYQSKKGTDVKLPCVKATSDNTAIKVEWLKDGEQLSLENQDNSGLSGKLSSAPEIDDNGYLVLRNLTASSEGVYTCRVVVGGGSRVQRRMEVRLMPDIVTMENTKLTVKEGENFTLKCDVWPGVNAKRMWNKEGQLVFPESGSGLDILEQGGVLTVAEAKPHHSGEWKCIASTYWGHDTIIYWVSVLSRARIPQQACTTDRRTVPVIESIVAMSNSSVRLDWTVHSNLNKSCYEDFMIVWWSKASDSDLENQTVELTRSTATVNGLVVGVAYYFQVNLVRDKLLKDFVYGQTKSFKMQYSETQEEHIEDSIPFLAVILVVVVVLIIVLVLGGLAYLKRDTVARFLSEKTKSKHELPEMSSKLVMNPDFMASLAPQWPEPEPLTTGGGMLVAGPPPPQWPEPEQGLTETHAFLPQRRQASSRRNSKDSLSSWSSLFNVVSNETGDGNNHHQHKQKPLDRRRQNY